MNNAEKVKYWIDLADYDLETAKTMLQGRRYLYVGFMCHQTIEKVLKAYYTFKKEDTPPYTHNLKRLAEEAGVISLLSDAQLDLIEELVPMNIEARYPTYKELLLKSLSGPKCEQLIFNTTALCNWIKQQL